MTEITSLIITLVVLVWILAGSSAASHCDNPLHDKPRYAHLKFLLVGPFGFIKRVRHCFVCKKCF